MRDKLYVDGGPSSTKTVGHLRMEGREVFKHAVVNIAGVMEETILAAGLKPQDIDWFVPHQANQRILEGTAKRLGIAAGCASSSRSTGTATPRRPRSRWRSTPRQGRPDQARRSRLMEAMGGGFTWGAVVLSYRW